MVNMAAINTIITTMHIVTITIIMLPAVHHYAGCHGNILRLKRFAGFDTPISAFRPLRSDLLGILKAINRGIPTDFVATVIRNILKMRLLKISIMDAIERYTRKEPDTDASILLPVKQEFIAFSIG